MTNVVVCFASRYDHHHLNYSTIIMSSVITQTKTQTNVGTDVLNIIIMTNPLTELAENIVSTYKQRLKSWEDMPRMRMQILKDMHQELMQLKVTFQAMYPEQSNDVEDILNKKLP